MKHIKKYLCLALLLGSTSLFAESNSTATPCSTSSCNGPKTVLPLVMQLGSNLYTQYHKPFYSKEEGDCSKWMADINLTYRYARSYDGCETIAPLLFGSHSLNFMGTDINPNDGTALIADYFGLSQKSDITMNLNPKIKNNILDFQFATGGDHVWLQINLPIMHSKWELYDNCSTFNGSVTVDSLQDSIERTLQNNTLPSYTSPQDIAEAAAIPANNLTVTDQDFNAFIKDFNNKGFSKTPLVSASNPNYEDIQQFSYMKAPNLSESSADNAEFIDITTAYTDLNPNNVLSTDSVTPAENIKEALNGFTFGDLENRKYNKFNLNGCSGKWKLADIQLMLGYDFCKNECYHIGAYLKAVIPTGTAINEKYAEFILQPLIGNGRHFELGGGLNGHWEVWSCDDKTLDVNIDGYITHMFKKSSFRTFDLLNKPMTRYALMKVLSPSSEENSDEWGYQEELVVAGDINATCVDVKSTVRGEAIIDLIYSSCNWDFGLGYAFSGKSKEELNCPVSKLLSYSRRYGLKGTTGTGLLKLTDPNGYNDVTIAPHAVLSVKANNFIDNGDMYSFNNNDTLDANDEDNKELLYSLPYPNRSGLMEGQILHKIFAHVDYTWSENCWMPTLGVVGSVSFTPDSSNKTAKYWDLGARVGCSF